MVHEHQRFSFCPFRQSQRGFHRWAGVAPSQPRRRLGFGCVATPVNPPETTRSTRLLVGPVVARVGKSAAKTRSTKSGFRMIQRMVPGCCRPIRNECSASSEYIAVQFGIGGPRLGFSVHPWISVALGLNLAKELACLP